MTLIEPIACRHCGSTPVMKSENVCYGHGDFATEWRVACKCGMQTRGFSDGYDGPEQQAKRKAVAVWNAKPET